jgi:UDPglucose--hexose-1-phosphate uridylyltransferase
MLDFSLPHRRKNPLTGEWVLVSPQRNKRPWQGKVEDTPKISMPEHDPECYLCPGNTRANKEKNPDYEKTFVFTNDHPAILPGIAKDVQTPNDLITARQEPGTCRVICYSPLHNRTMADMNTDAIGDIIRTWIAEYKTIGSDPEISYVQIFENKGQLMGASSPHPHCQIWATHSVPTIPALEQVNQKEYLAHHHGTLLADYLRYEHDEKKRIVTENDAFTVLVPYWAVWPYETMILPRTHTESLLSLTAVSIPLLADIISRITRAYDRVFDTSFPYSMGIHQAPTDNLAHDEWLMHFHFYPPLLRSATVKKYLVGYEMMAESQRDITPEDAAATLRELCH